MQKLALGIALVAVALAAGPASGRPRPPVPGRILVRLDPARSPDCAHCRFAHGAPLGGGLDAVNAAAGVTAVRHLHAAHHAPTVDLMVAGLAHALDAARRANPWRREREAGGDLGPLLRGLASTYVVEAPHADPVALAAEYRRSPLVAWASPDHQAELLAFAPTDPFLTSSGSWGQDYVDLWGIRQVGAPAVWPRWRGAGVRIGVLDTGIELAHDDLAGNVCVNPGDPPNGVDDDGNGWVDDAFCGYNFAARALGAPPSCPAAGFPGDPLGVPCDDEGHGSHVSGIAAALANGVGVVGVAPEARLMPLKIFDRLLAPLSGIYEAFLYAVTAGADVLNASFRCWDCGLRPYLTLAHRAGILVVASAGNDGGPIETPEEPASLAPLAFTVGAADRFGEPTDFSSWGPALDLLAPGGGSVTTCQCAGTVAHCTATSRNVLSARSFLAAPRDVPGCLATNQLVPFGGAWALRFGTSMAAPHAAGAAALVLERFPWMTPMDARFVLRRAAVDVLSTGTGVDERSGFGRLAAHRAVAGTVLVRAVADTWVDSGRPFQNFGAVPRLRVRGSAPRRIAYVKFDLRHVAAHQGAALRLCTPPDTGAASGGRVHPVAADGWSELGTTWDNRPGHGEAIATVVEPVTDAMPEATCVAIDVTPHVRPGRMNAFAIVKPFAAKEDSDYLGREGHAAERAPHLLLSPCGGCTPCNGATVVTANAPLLPGIVAALAWSLVGRRRRLRK
jgi:hypothetical protein